MTTSSEKMVDSLPNNIIPLIVGALTYESLVDIFKKINRNISSIQMNLGGGVILATWHERWRPLYTPPSPPATSIHPQIPKPRHNILPEPPASNNQPSDTSFTGRPSHSGCTATPTSTWSYKSLRGWITSTHMHSNPSTSPTETLVSSRWLLTSIVITKNYCHIPEG